VRPLRGFRAPILSEKNDLRRVVLPKELIGPERRAAAVIRQRLAFDGLLPVLAEAIEILGPEEMATNGASGLPKVRDLGFPVDLLRYFPLVAGESPEPALTISRIARQLARGESGERVKSNLQAVPFAFSKTHRDFKVADETGESEIGLLRLQIGSGFRNGIIKGGIIDVTGQLTREMPGANFLVTVADDYFENIHWLAMNCWRLRRAGSLTLIREQGPVRAWAQDNGKAGVLIGPNGTRTLATIVPRHASQDEVNSPMFAGESFLMDGLSAAGHQVLHSPLLFQGGNLMAVHDPSSRQRLLLISETELYRNVALGLTREQAQAAFCQEFGVDKCLVLPSVSYHLDYDMTLRQQNGRIIAFVNDAGAAARLIVQRAIAALENGRVLSTDTAREAIECLATARISRLLPMISGLCRSFSNEHGQYQDALVRLFAVEPTDSAVFNFLCFLAALDILASEVLPEAGHEYDQTTQKYLAALRELEAGARAQREKLHELGWKTILVPSMPDLDHCLNYLNGLQDQTRYLMPAMGGFYGSLDEAAARTFQKELGNDVRIVRVYNPEAQQKHGGVHCVAASYPRVEEAASR
jgi:hypothetical protein